MRTATIVRYASCVVMGGLLAALGFHALTWQFWAIFGTMLVYGLAIAAEDK